MTFTLAGEGWQELRGRMFRLAYDLRQEIGALQWAWSVEPNPKGTGHHVHALQWGSFVANNDHVLGVRDSTLSRMAQRRGLGRVVDVRLVAGREAAARYPLKMLAAHAYTTKMASDPSTLERYLSANGARLVHVSRGFWRRPDGSSIPSTRVAMREAREAVHGPSDGHWVLEHKERGAGAPLTLPRSGPF